MIRYKNRLPGMAISLALLGSAAPAHADGPSHGSVVVAKPGGHAILVWDASTDVGAALQKSEPPDQITTQLEVAAVRILMDRAKTLTSASDIRVKVVYDRTGDVSPLYKAETFSGIEHLLIVSATRKAAISGGKTWSASLDAGVLPAGVTTEVTGKYPT